jgi:hypothetical protein
VRIPMIADAVSIEGGSGAQPKIEPGNPNRTAR